MFLSSAINRPDEVPFSGFLFPFKLINGRFLGVKTYHVYISGAFRIKTLHVKIKLKIVYKRNLIKFYIFLFFHLLMATNDMIFSKQCDNFQDDPLGSRG